MINGAYFRDYKNNTWGRGIFQIDIITGETNAYYKKQTYIERPNLSPDGRKIVFCMAAEGKENQSMAAYQIELKTNAEPELIRYNPNENSYSAIWSPDGGDVACICNQNDNSSSRILKISVNGGEIKELIRYTYNSIDQNNFLRGMAWSPNGKYIAFIRHFADDCSEIWMLNIENGDTFQLHETGTIFKESPTWSPDGKNLYYNAWKEDVGSPKLWALENFLPVE